MLNMDDKMRFLLESTDVSSYKSRKFLMNLDESGTNTALDAAISKMYEYAVNKYNKIEFGDIPNTKGDITKFSGYKSTQDVIDSLDECSRVANLVEFEDLKTVKTALDYLIKNKIEFNKAFLANNYSVIMIYNVTVYSIVAATNLVITEWIEYSKQVSAHPDLKIIRLNKNQKNLRGDYRLIDALENFNKACLSGDIGKYMAQTAKSDKFIGMVTGVGITALTIIASATVVIPIIRKMVYYVFYIRMSLSDYLKTQSEFLKNNASSLNAGNFKGNSVDLKRVKKKQLDMSKRLETLSNKIVVKFEDGEKAASKELDKRIDIKDMTNSFSSMSGNDDDDDDDNPLTSKGQSSGFLL